jgi:NitT/TauT family transport system substrate-binding protein
VVLSSYCFYRFQRQFEEIIIMRSFLGLIFVLTTFGAPFVPAQAFANEKVKLALNWKPEPQFGGFYAASVHGDYKKQNLDVEIVPGGSGTPVVAMIAGGKIDFGIVSADEVVISRSRGSGVVALFAVYQTNPQGIMTHAERGFQNIGDVYKSDGVLALQAGLPYAMLLAKKYGGAKVKQVPYQGGITNFLSDAQYSQQCFVTSEPLAAKKKGVKTKTFLIAEEGYNPYTTVLATRTEVLAKNPQLVKAIVNAVRAGWREYLDHPEAANKLMSGLNKSMDMDTFIESAEGQKNLIETAVTKHSGLGKMTEDRWQTLANQLLDLKIIDKQPDTKSLFENP